MTVFGTPKFTDKKGAAQLVQMLPIERVEHVRDPVSISPMVNKNMIQTAIYSIVMLYSDAILSGSIITKCIIMSHSLFYSFINNRTFDKR